VTGFDIIFFWVARMIMMTMHFMKDEDGKPQVPFKTVYVTGLIRDEGGDKMSKSKGNVLDPIDMIDGIGIEELLEKRTGNMMQPKLAAKIAKRTQKEFPEGIEAHGTDAVRFTLAALASTGRDVNWSMKRLDGYRNFCNKIWNASRYVLMNTVGEEALDAAAALSQEGKGNKVSITPAMLEDCGANGETFELSTADQWITSQLQQVTTVVRGHFDQYRFDLASQALYEFIWNEYCGWYLELSKPVLTSETSSVEAKRGTRRTLVRVLEETLRLAHPLMPFITEEIWQQVKELAAYGEGSAAAGVEKADSIMMAAYPESDDSLINAQAESDIDWLKGVITGVRNIRGEMNIAPSKLLPVFFANGSEADLARLEANRQFLSSLAALESITWLNAGDEAPMAATQLVGEMEVLVPLAGIIDKSAETARLNKEIDKINKDFARVEGKLNNPKFVDKAPAEVVDKEKAKLADMTISVAKLEEQLVKLASL